MNGSHVNEPWDQRVTEHRFTYECWRLPLVLAARVSAGLGDPSAPPTPGLGPRVASLTPEDGEGGGEQTQTRIRVEAVGRHPQVQVRARASRLRPSV